MRPFSGLPARLRNLAILDTVRDSIANKMNQRIGDVLNDIVVQLSISTLEREIHGLTRGFGGVANGSRKARVEITDRDHARSGDLVLQVVGELGEFIDIGIDAAHETFELSEHFSDVRGNFGEGARQNVEVVVTIHFEFTEIEKIVGSDSRERAMPAERIHLRGLTAWHERRANAAEFVLFLEVRDFTSQARLRELQHFYEF